MSPYDPIYSPFHRYGWPGGRIFWEHRPKQSEHRGGERTILLWLPAGESGMGFAQGEPIVLCLLFPFIVISCIFGFVSTIFFCVFCFYASFSPLLLSIRSTKFFKHSNSFFFLLMVWKLYILFLKVVYPPWNVQHSQFTKQNLKLIIICILLLNCTGS